MTIHYTIGRYSIAVILFICVFCARAQNILTLEDAIAMALQNNYEIRLAKNDSAMAALDYGFRNVVFLPRVNATAGIVQTDNNQKQEFSSGEVKEGDVVTGNVNAALNLNWTLFDGLKMFATRDRVEEYLRLGELEIKNQVINTVAEVINTYYLIVRQKQQLKAIEEQMSISQTRVDLSQRKLEIGVGAKPELLQSKVDLNAQKASQLQQLNFIKQIKERLNHLITPLPPGSETMNNTDYDVIDTIPINFSLTIDEIRAGIENTNPLLLIAEKNIDIAGVDLRSIKAERFPIIQFNAAYNFTRTNNDVTLNPAFPLYNRNQGFNYGLSATIPILNYRNTTRLIRQAELNIGFQQLMYNNERALVNLNVVTAYNSYEFQKQTLALEEANILLADENVDIILETYRLGSSTYIQLREAQKSLLDAYDRLIAARYNTKLAETELLKLKGDLVR